MMEVIFSIHADDVLQERNIPVDWVWRTIEFPDRVFEESDGNTHYVKVIWEYEGRILRVVVNQNVNPDRVVTLFFDRRLRGRL
jgi:hypothetical protein